MTQTWIDWATRAPATYDPRFPQGKHGYASKAARTLAEIKYVVNHDARGFRGYLAQGHRPGEQASWTFTIQTDGTLLQHLPLEAIAWTSGSYPPNVEGIGCEHESVTVTNPAGSDPPFTPAQLVTEARLYTSLQGLCPNLGLPTFGDGVRLHKLVSPGTTTCPNGRDRYVEYDKLLAPPEEDDMGLPFNSGKETFSLIPGKPLTFRVEPPATRGAHWLSVRGPGGFPTVGVTLLDVNGQGSEILVTGGIVVNGSVDSVRVRTTDPDITVTDYWRETTA